MVPAFDVIRGPGSFCYGSANWLGAHLQKANSTLTTKDAQARLKLSGRQHESPSTAYKEGTNVAFRLDLWLPNGLRNR